MKKELAKYFAQYSGLDLSIEPDVIVEVVDTVRTDLDFVLDEIFAPDPVSGLPRGDIQYYLSSDGNPEVKAWLERNLLAPRAKSVGSSIEGVTDDLIHEMNRGSDESFEDYVSRLGSIRDEALNNSNS